MGIGEQRCLGLTLRDRSPDRDPTSHVTGNATKLIRSLVIISAMAITGCTQTNIQQMSRNTFKVATQAAPACGPEGARNVAFKAAAIEVIRRGGDKFIIQGDREKSNWWTGDHNQDMVVRMIPNDSSEASNALSAREQLGPDWQSIVAKGVPTTCN